MKQLRWLVARALCLIARHRWRYHFGAAPVGLYQSATDRECARCGRREVREAHDIGRAKTWVRTLQRAKGGGS